MITNLAAYKQSVFVELKRKLRDKITRQIKNGEVNIDNEEFFSGIEEESKLDVSAATMTSNKF